MSAAALVTEIAVLTGVGLGAGHLLDRSLATDPWLSLLGTAGGFAAGITRVFLGLRKLEPPDDDPDHPAP